MASRRIKILAFVEAGTVTGPAKNLIEFARQDTQPGDAFGHSVKIDTVIATFSRSRSALPDGNGRGVASINDRPIQNRFTSAARNAGIEIHLIPERFRFDTRVIDEMRRIVRVVNPDIVQTHSVKSHFLVRVSAISSGRPWVAFHHGYTDPDVKMRAYNQLDRWSLQAADRIVTVSKAFQEELESIGVDGQKVRVVQNSVDSARFRSASVKDIATVRRKIGGSVDARLILAVGRLSREKRHVELVEAFALLRRAFPIIDAKLVIVGDGPERLSIEKCASALGVSDRVILAGHVSDVRPYLLVSDVLALPSSSEGSPNVLLEAMAAGLPVVATRVGGVPEIVCDDVNALLVEPGRPDRMAASIAMLLADPELAFRLAEEARRTVALRHSIAVRHRALTAIYEELVARRPVQTTSVRQVGERDTIRRIG